MSLVQHHKTSYSMELGINYVHITHHLAAKALTIIYMILNESEGLTLGKGFYAEIDEKLQ